MPADRMLRRDEPYYLYKRIPKPGDLPAAVLIERIGPVTRIAVTGVQMIIVYARDGYFKGPALFSGMPVPEPTTYSGAVFLFLSPTSFATEA